MSENKTLILDIKDLRQRVETLEQVIAMIPNLMEACENIYPQTESLKKSLISTLKGIEEANEILKHHPAWIDWVYIICMVTFVIYAVFTIAVHFKVI